MTYLRVHRAGETLYADQQSWLWGMTPDESAARGELLDGVSCCSSVERLVGYFATFAHGAVEDAESIAEFAGEFEVVLFDGEGTEDVAGEPGEYIVTPAVELGRYTWEQVIAAWEAEEELAPQYRTECPTGYELPE